MSYLKIKSYAKINLALNVLGKSKSLHKIESIVSFLDLHDEILIRKINSTNHKIRFVGKFSTGIKSKNTISQLLENIDKKKLLKHKYQVVVKKNIPSAAGLGGGSMNAANILRFLIKKKFIKLSQKKIRTISNLIGSDVILGISSKSTVLKSNNVIKKFFRSPRYYTLLVRPNFGCSTKKIYSKVKNFTKPKFNYPRKTMFGSKFLINQDNALEKITFLKYPKLKEIKSFLENLKSPLFVRMTGSGSVIVAYYQSKRDCELAKVQYKRKFNSHWCIESKTI